MTSRLAAILLLPVLALSACGSDKKVDASAYTCAQFQKSLNTKGDNTAGNYINQLRKRAKLNQPRRTEVQALTLGIVFSCRGKPGSTRPADRAVTIAKQIATGQFKLPSRGKKNKKPNK
jgi:hypothetical protein